MATLYTLCGTAFQVDGDVAIRFAESKFELFSGYVCFAGSGKVWKNSLHRLLCAGPYVDHINGDKLDNRSSNLRSCTQSQNLLNAVKHRGKNKYKGVCWHKEKQKWRVTVRDLAGVKHHLGYFLDELEAVQVYEQAAKLYHGEFYKAQVL